MIFLKITFCGSATRSANGRTRSANGKSRSANGKSRSANSVSAKEVITPNPPTPNQFVCLCLELFAHAPGLDPGSYKVASSFCLQIPPKLSLHACKAARSSSGGLCATGSSNWSRTTWNALQSEATSRNNIEVIALLHVRRRTRRRSQRSRPSAGKLAPWRCCLGAPQPQDDFANLHVKQDANVGSLFGPVRGPKQLPLERCLWICLGGL